MDEVIAYRLDRAYETLADAKLLFTHDRIDSTVNRLYYACFYVVTALLQTEDLNSAKHTGVRSLFNKHFVHEGLVPRSTATIYNDLFERRTKIDYQDLIAYPKEEVQKWIPQAEAFIEEISKLVRTHPM